MLFRCDILLNVEHAVIHWYLFFDSMSNKNVLEYSVYKPFFVFFGIVDMVYDKLFKVCKISNKENILMTVLIITV